MGGRGLHHVELHDLAEPGFSDPRRVSYLGLVSRPCCTRGGSALTHHPHVHMIVLGGGFSLDKARWVPCRPRFFLAVEELSALFRGLFLHKLRAAYRAGALQFFGKHSRLIDPRAFAAYLAPLW